MGTALILGLKGSVFFPFFYHTFVGMRHWSWDIFAVGIRDMGVLYQTGYIAIAAALVFTGTGLFYSFISHKMTSLVLHHCPKCKSSP